MSVPLGFPLRLGKMKLGELVQHHFSRSGPSQMSKVFAHWSGVNALCNICIAYSLFDKA